MSRDGLLHVQDPPMGKKELPESLVSIHDPDGWMAHEDCAKVVPETWVDMIDLTETLPDGTYVQESRVFGVDAIVRDRWNLVTYHSSRIDFVIMTPFRNAPPATRDDKRRMVLPSNAQRGSVPNRSTCLVQDKDNVVFPTLCCARLRRKSF